jgi:nicotinate dehydrogenase subunit A
MTRRLLVDKGLLQLIMRAQALLERNPAPSEAEIRAHMEPNLCRCGTQMRILRAIRRASETLRRAAPVTGREARR